MPAICWWNNPLMYDKTNVHYRSKGKNRFFYDKNNTHYRIRGNDALVRASMGKLAPWQPWTTIFTTRARQSFLSINIYISELFHAFISFY